MLLILIAHLTGSLRLKCNYANIFYMATFISASGSINYFIFLSYSFYKIGKDVSK